MVRKKYKGQSIRTDWKGKDCKYLQIEKGWRLFKTKKCARKFADKRKKKYNYNPTVYQTLSKEHAVIY